MKYVALPASLLVLIATGNYCFKKIYTSFYTSFCVIYFFLKVLLEESSLASHFTVRSMMLLGIIVITVSSKEIKLLF